MSQARQKPSVVPVDLLSLGIATLTGATSFIHLFLALSIGPPRAAPFPLLFYLNFIGYLVLLAALFAPALSRFRRAIRWLFILYAALTFALWFVLAPRHDPEGFLDKALEILLIILLLIDDRRAALAGERLLPGSQRVS